MTTIPGTPTEPLVIVKGATFDPVFTWRDENGTAINLTGYTAARFMAREVIDSATPFISLSIGSGITLGGAAGTITLNMSAAATGALTQDKGVFEIDVTDGSGKVTSLVIGDLLLYKKVAR
jgi:hypothetical protein